MRHFISFLFMFIGLCGVVFGLFQSLSDGGGVAMVVTVIFSIFFFVGLYSFRSDIKNAEDFEIAQAIRTTQNYDWYKTEHPENVMSNKVSCHKCGSEKITIQRLLKRTYFRSHICTVCGSTLYFSKE